MMSLQERSDLILAFAKVLFANGQATDQTISATERLGRALEAARDRPHALERVDPTLDEERMQPPAGHRQHDDVDSDRKRRELRRVVSFGIHDHYLSR